MKVSEAIAELKIILRQCGDLDMVSLTEVDGQFCIEGHRVFEVIEPEGMNCFVCAYMESPESRCTDFEGSDGGPLPRRLELVKGNK